MVIRPPWEHITHTDYKLFKEARNCVTFTLSILDVPYVQAYSILLMSIIINRATFNFENIALLFCT
jgi:hypothetical protein